MTFLYCILILHMLKLKKLRAKRNLLASSYF